MIPVMSIAGTSIETESRLVVVRGKKEEVIGNDVEWMWVAVMKMF